MVDRLANECHFPAGRHNEAKEEEEEEEKTCLQYQRPSFDGINEIADANSIDNQTTIDYSEEARAGSKHDITTLCGGTEYAVSINSNGGLIGEGNEFTSAVSVQSSSEWSHVLDWEPSSGCKYYCEVGNIEVMVDKPSTNDDWSVVSGVELVRSINSASVAYKDALVSGENLAQGERTESMAVVQNFNKEVQDGAIGSTMSAEVNKDKVMDDSLFDTSFIQDGVKFGRGGRGELIFKGNQKATTQMKAIHTPKASQTTEATGIAYSKSTL